MEKKEVFNAADELGDIICHMMGENKATIADGLIILSMAVTDVLEALAIVSNVDPKHIMEDFKKCCDVYLNKPKREDILKDLDS